MEITEAILSKYIEDFRNQQQQLSNQQQNLVSQIHAISGAIQILEVLKKKLTEDDNQVV